MDEKSIETLLKLWMDIKGAGEGIPLCNEKFARQPCVGLNFHAENRRQLAWHENRQWEYKKMKTRDKSENRLWNEGHGEWKGG